MRRNARARISASPQVRVQNFSHTTPTHTPYYRGENAVHILKATSLEDYGDAKDNLDWERISRQVRRTPFLHTPRALNCYFCAVLARRLLTVPSVDPRPNRVYVQSSMVGQRSPRCQPETIDRGRIRKACGGSSIGARCESRGPIRRGTCRLASSSGHRWGKPGCSEFSGYLC